MRTTRVSEGRGTFKKASLLIGLPVVAVMAAGLAMFFSGMFDAMLTEEKGARSVAAAQLTSELVELPPASAPGASTKLETASMTNSVSVGLSSVQAIEPQGVIKVPPAAKFGEVLDEGWGILELPADQSAETWFTLQVDTQTQSITNFFALYDNDSQLISSVKVQNYTQGEPLDNAELTLYYDDGAKRTLYFDGQEGTMSVNQHFEQPSGPSMFSADLRVAMVSYGLQLNDETGQVNLLMNLDPTGLSLGEMMILKQPAERIVADMLREIGELVEQVEDQRDS